MAWVLARLLQRRAERAPAEPEPEPELFWVCRRCTFHNESAEAASACGLCGTERGAGFGPSTADGATVVVVSDSAADAGVGAGGLGYIRMLRGSGLGGVLGVYDGVTRRVLWLTTEPCKMALNGAIRGFFAVCGLLAGALAGAASARSAIGRRNGASVLRSAGMGALAGAILSVETLEASQILFDSTHSHVRSRTRLANAMQLSRNLFHVGGYAYFIQGSLVPRPTGLLPEELRMLPCRTVCGDAGHETRADDAACACSHSCGNECPGTPTREGLRPAFGGVKDCATSPIAERTHDQCAICFDPFLPGETVRMLPACTHEYHARCIDPWLRKRTTCPVCRTEVRQKGAPVGADAIRAALNYA